MLASSCWFFDARVNSERLFDYDIGSFPQKEHPDLSSWIRWSGALRVDKMPVRKHISILTMVFGSAAADINRKADSALLTMMILVPREESCGRREHLQKEHPEVRELEMCNL